ncbi:hypothetical protein NTE_01457 [Candidatus Nitrososphaera evergladensis SR1]|uniref:Uncharacterized protein n=1 Tax=Candidatus Nitrososphaera evergladensis SR1 TaxID=1459636 RepID=A0A075MPN1_9ARCH|nr:hypothetical protein [Candidatus Nitrososphaera evergladensis]AIF83521.1 hypothetical protein NTE_01457 [Candidatus Nitrososphaera evergladensis SR1]
MAQKGSEDERTRKPAVKHRQYDDKTLENMMRYYNLGENYESLLRYIKRRGLVEGDS